VSGSELHQLPFTMAGLRAAYGRGITVTDVIGEVYRRIDTVGDPGIFLYLIEEKDALSAARDLGPFDIAAKPLWGLPFVIKDNIDAAGLDTTAACPAYAYEAEDDAFVVDQLRKAGAILIGKTNLDQFATGLVGLRSPYPIPKNAIDPIIVPGGSSSGSAVSVAHGLVTFSLGTDTAGSGRVPAALNNIVGLKPTLGAISNRGVVPACRTLDTVSIFALTVEEAYEVFSVAAMFDADDPYARPIATQPLAPLPPTFRVGVPDLASREFFGDLLQANAYTAALGKLAALGAEIVEVDFAPFYEIAAMLYEGAWTAERLTVIEDLLRQDPEAIHPVTRQVIGAAESLTAADAFRGIYRLQELQRRAEPAVNSVELFCLPSIPTFYSVGELAADPIEPNSRLGTYTNFVNLMDMCALAVPMAPRSDGRPGSVTLIAPAGHDAQIAAVASALHQQWEGTLGATAWRLPRAAAANPEPGSGEMALAVVGAHMSGLPLNGEVTKLGGRFLYAAETAPNYRFYSLPGGPPYRPGLVQDNDGAAISLEVWALPRDRFGEFIQGVPSPLCIGTLTLNNGRTVKGFLCEANGTARAEDITAYGGWRAYLQSLSLNTTAT